MLLVKKCHFFHYFVGLKIRQEIRLNNVLDTKNLFLTVKGRFLKVLKMVFLKRG